MDLSFYLQILLRRLHYVLLFVTLGTAIGISIAIVTPSKYATRSLLLLERAQIPGELASSTVTTGVGEALQLIRQRVLSRTSMLDLADRLSLFPEEGDPDFEPISDDGKISDLRGRIEIRSYQPNQPGPTFVDVSFTAGSGEEAALVANELVSMIMAENVDMRTTLTGQTLNFFETEAARLEARLSELNSQILDFQQQNLDALPGNLDFRRNRLATQQERLDQLVREEATLKDRRERMVALFETAGLGAFTAPQRTPEEQRLENLRSEYQSLSAVLSTSNPRLTLLASRITNLEELVETQRSQQAVLEGNEQALNAYEIQLADLDGQIEINLDQQATLEQEIADLQRSIDATPANAITLQALERDYSNVQSQYNRMVASRNEAETGDIIESLAKGQRITLLEEARVPLSPNSPNRNIIAASGFGAGLAAGLAFVVLLELLNRAIRRPQDIEGALNISVFSTIPYIRTRQEIMRRRALVLGTIVILLIGLPSALWYVDRQIMPLQLLIDQVLSQDNSATA